MQTLALTFVGPKSVMCTENNDNGVYLRIHFLKAIGHSLRAHSKAFQTMTATENYASHVAGVDFTPSVADNATVVRYAMCEVCLMTPDDGVAHGTTVYVSIYDSVPRLSRRCLMAAVSAELQCDKRI